MFISTWINTLPCLAKKKFIRINLKLILNIWVYQQESIWHLTGSTAKAWLITCMNNKNLTKET